MEKKQRVLIVEDEKNIVDILRFNLRKEGYDTQEAYDGEVGLALALQEAPDLILLDLMLPKMNGFEVCKRLRDQGRSTPVIIITAREAEKDKILGLDLGADDYLVKPFDFDELLARLRAMTRKHVGQRTNTLTVGDLTLDTAQRRVTRDGEEIALLPKEFAILEYLMRHPGTVLSREQIEDQIWNYEYAGSSNNVDGYLSRLRKKIDEGRGEKLLHTVRGMGWAIRPPAGGKAP